MRSAAAPTRAPRGLAPGVCFGVAAVALVVWVWWMGRGFGLFSDEWNVTILANRGDLLEPFNGHLSIVPEVVYLVLSRTAGLGHYGPYRAVALTCYVALAVLVGWHARRRANPVVGALVGGLVLWSSAARLTLLFPLLINFTVPLACCAAIWLLLDADRSHDLAGVALLAVALCSSAVGVVTAIVVLVELLVRRAGPKRLLRYLAPCVLWVLWWIGYHASSTLPRSIGDFFSFAGRELIHSFSALCVGWTPGGWILLVAFVAVGVGGATRWHSFDARAAGALAGLVAFLVLTSAGREGLGANGQPLPPIPPDTDRYLFVNGIFVLSFFATVLGPPLRRWLGAPPLRTRGRQHRRRAAVAGVTVAAILGLLAANAVSLSHQVATYRHDQLAYQTNVRGVLRTTEEEGRGTNPNRVIPVNFVPVTAGEYLHLISQVGSPLNDHP